MAEMKFPPVEWDIDDTGSYVKAVQDFFYRGKNGKPRQVAPFLTFLDELVDEAEGKYLGALAEDAQLEADIKSWRIRSKAYRKAVDDADPDDTLAIHDSVLMPLIMGWYPGEEEQGLLDAVNPVRIAHGAKVTREAMDDAMARFKEDLSKPVKDAAKKGFAALEWIFDENHPWRKWGVAGVAGLGALGTAFLYVRVTRIL